MGSIFDQARDAITANVVEHFTRSERAYWQGGEYWTLNPTRADSDIGSFSINERGLWNDFAGGSGDLVTLASEMRGCTKKQAAEEIIKASGGVVRDDDKPAKVVKRKADKVPPMIPAPDDALKQLNTITMQAWVIDRHGSPVKGWTYRTAQGGVAFAITRHEQGDKKDILPWYYGTDGKWHAGQAYEHGRPLYKLDIISKADKGTPILVVEGEKCASIEVPGYIVTTSAGGSKAMSRTDWAPLEGREVIIWPDADKPGIDYAGAIAKRLPGAKVLKITGKPDGWDLADAVADGVDPIEFIKLAMPCESDDKNGDAGEFYCLGHDQTHHYFLRRNVRMPYKIAIGAFTASRLISLAPVSYWMAKSLTTDGDGVKVQLAQDMVEAISFDVGQYRPERIRGAGVWRDQDGFVINDGAKLIRGDGEAINFDQHKGQHHYISSSVQFGAMSGHMASADEGKQLAELFDVQGWANRAQSVLAMGWSLIAPFGGILRWRPHAWITGRRGTGKSFVLEHLMSALCGPFAHRGSGKDSEAGLRRSLDMDARPVILDEMEPKGQRAAERVSAILDLARNASSDGSGYITLAAPDGGTQRFVVRSCFCFGSIQTPDEGAAIASRITMLELKAPRNQAEKFKRSSQLEADCLADPGRFRRRTFRRLGQIVQDIEYLRTERREFFGEQRRADQIAPMLSAAWAAQSDQSIQSVDGLTWLADISPWLCQDHDQQADDEEAVIGHLMSAHIRIDGNQTRTVGELLHSGYCADGTVDDHRAVLERYGIRVFSGGLAIKAKSDQIKTLLKDTPYATGYGAQIRRHRHIINDQPVQVRMAGGRAQCYVLNWAEFRADYIDGQPLLPAEPPF
jgi:putative DNA primase/helicase